MNRKSLTIIIFTLMSAVASAQADTVINDPVDHHALFTGAGWGNNMIWLGSTISRNQPFEYGVLAYSLNEKLTLSGTGFYLPELESSAPAFWSLGASYSLDITKWLNLTGSLYRYLVKPALADTLFGNFNYGDITMGVDWKILYTEISYSSFLMKDPPFYIQVTNSRSFQTPDFFNGKANISFDPYVNLLFGKLITSQTFDGTTTVTTTQTYVTPVTSGSGNSTTSGHGTSQGQGSSTTGTTTTTTTTTTTVPTSTTVYTESFRLTDMEVGLPVSLNFNFMSIEAEASYHYPLYSDSSLSSPKGFIFMVSAFFKIF